MLYVPNKWITYVLIKEKGQKKGQKKGVREREKVC